MNLLLTDPTNALIQCYLFQTVNYLSSSKYTMTYKALSRSANCLVSSSTTNKTVSSLLLGHAEQSFWLLCNFHIFSQMLSACPVFAIIIHPSPFSKRLKKGTLFLIHLTNTKWKEYISMKQGKVTFFGF